MRRFLQFRSGFFRAFCGSLGVALCEFGGGVFRGLHGFRQGVGGFGVLAFAGLVELLLRLRGDLRLFPGKLLFQRLGGIGFRFGRFSFVQCGNGLRHFLLLLRERSQFRLA